MKQKQLHAQAVTLHLPTTLMIIPTMQATPQSKIPLTRGKKLEFLPLSYSEPDCPAYTSAAEDSNTFLFIVPAVPKFYLLLVSCSQRVSRDIDALPNC